MKVMQAYLSIFSKFSLVESEICFCKSQNNIMPPQNLLEPFFTLHFDNTIPVRTFQFSFQGMPISAAIQARTGSGAPTEKRMPHAHADSWRARRSQRPPSPIS
jgi:hypothetical protein